MSEPIFNLDDELEETTSWDDDPEVDETLGAMELAERHGLEAVHEELRVLSYTGNPERFHEVNERFHNAIYAGSQNDYIAEITLATRVRVQPFRRAQFRNLGRLAKSHAEHDRVVVAILRGDKIGAAAAMRAHIEQVRGEYETYAVSV